MRIDKCYFCSTNVYPGHGKFNPVRRFNSESPALLTYPVIPRHRLRLRPERCQSIPVLFYKVRRRSQAKRGQHLKASGFRCHKSFKMKRNPRKMAWTKAFRKAAGKEMTIVSPWNACRLPILCRNAVEQSLQLPDIIHIGRHIRVRETAQYSCTIQSGAGRDDRQGDQTGRRDPSQEREGILHQPVCPSSYTV